MTDPARAEAQQTSDVGVEYWIKLDHYRVLAQPPSQDQGGDGKEQGDDADGHAQP